MTAKKDVRDLSVAEVVKRTKKWAAEYYDPEKKIATDPTQRVLQQIADHIAAGCMTQRKSMRNIVTDILGLLPQFKGKIPVLPEPTAGALVTLDLPIGVAVVPLENPNHHDYPIGKPCLVSSLYIGNDARAYQMDGSTGNFLPRAFGPRPLRPATEAEIKRLMASLARAKEGKKAH